MLMLAYGPNMEKKNWQDGEVWNEFYGMFMIAKLWAPTIVWNPGSTPVADTFLASMSDLQSQVQFPALQQF